jgi:hypothetical protein
MRARVLGAVLLGACLTGSALTGCHTLRGEASLKSLAQAPEALAALQASRFEEAERLSLAALAAEDRNAQAHLVAALTRYKRAMHQLISDLIGVGAAYFAQGFNEQYLTFALETAEREFAAADAHLAAAARDREVVLELCLACWEVDWNRDGRMDRFDRHLLEVELDADGRDLPEDDPRRRPVFRFDHGDVHWARAMLSFQRAALQVLSAYRPPAPGDFMQAARGRGGPARLVIRLKDAEAVRRARGLLEQGLAEADRSRRAYLAETDDEREWLPNPRQKSHPLPLPVDEALYRTWEELLGDLGRLLSGEEGLGVADVAQLGDHVWADPPRGFLDIRALLDSPGDITVDLAHAERLDREEGREAAEAVLRDVFGDKFRAEMKPSPLPSRLARMKAEVERGEESLERKLRYLLWVN